MQQAAGAALAVSIDLDAPIPGATAAVLDALPFGVAILNRANNIVFANASARVALSSVGHPTNQFRLIHAETERALEPDETPVARALRGETVPMQDYLVRTAQGGRKGWVECTAAPVYDSAGTIAGAVFTFRGIDERKQKELARDAGAQLHDFVYHENLAGIVHSAVDGRIIDCNDAILRMLGYASRDELIALRAHQLYSDPSDRDKLLKLLSATGRLSEYEVSLRRKDGSRCWTLMSVRLLKPPTGDVGGALVSTVIDITERKRWEENLRKSEQRFAAFMRHLPGVAFIKDLNGRYVYYNDASAALFGKQPNEITGRTDEEIWPSEHAAVYRENDESVIRSRRHYEFVESVRHDDGEHTWLIYKFPIIEHGEVILVGGVGIDITERRIMEQQLMQVRKMDALGLLAGGVAHDFNNLLTVISGFGQLAVEALGNPPEPVLADYLTRILDGARRASGITGQLLAFSRREVVKPAVLDLTEILGGMEKLLRTMVGEHVDLRVRLGREACLILSDEHQLQQVIINLAVNARDAMPLGGELTIRCERLASPIARDGGPASGVLLEVRDNGIGMDEATKNRIFDPFFTSKEKGKGTGLGLSTVYGIVSQAKGMIEVETQPMEGTVFRVYFPVAEGARASKKELAPAGISDGNERILLVEDDASVRNLAKAVLIRLGYQVVEAESGAVAMNVWERERGRFDILLSDVVMPQMSGGELAIALRERNPHLKVLFMSGYAGDMLSRSGVLEGQTQLISKPFTPDALGKKLRDVLDA